MIPKKMKIGAATYTIQQQPKHPRRYGQVLYGVKTICINMEDDAARNRNTLWHETVHAILHEMGNPLHKNEAFVTEFSTLLSNAIDSARF